MKIDEIYKALDNFDTGLRDKAALARRTAKRAHLDNNTTKRDKFNSVARVYEMTIADLGPLLLELYGHTSEAFRDDQIPF
jgi:hypothetical protein